MFIEQEQPMMIIIYDTDNFIVQTKECIVDQKTFFQENIIIQIVWKGSLSKRG